MKVLIGSINPYYYDSGIIKTGISVDLVDFDQANYKYSILSNEQKSSTSIGTLDHLFVPVSPKSQVRPALSVYNPPIFSVNSGLYRWWNNSSGNKEGTNVAVANIVGSNSTSFTKHFYNTGSGVADVSTVGIKLPMILSGYGKNVYSRSGIGDSTDITAWKTGPTLLGPIFGGTQIPKDIQPLREYKRAGLIQGCNNHTYNFERYFIQQVINPSLILNNNYERTLSVMQTDVCQWETSERDSLLGYKELVFGGGLKLPVSGKLTLTSKIKGGLNFGHADLIFTCMSGSLLGQTWTYSTVDPWIGNKNNILYLNNASGINGIDLPSPYITLIPQMCAYSPSKLFPTGMTIDYSITVTLNNGYHEATIVNIAGCDQCTGSGINTTGIELIGGLFPTGQRYIPVTTYAVYDSSIIPCSPACYVVESTTMYKETYSLGNTCFHESGIVFLDIDFRSSGSLVSNFNVTLTGDYSYLISSIINNSANSMILQNGSYQATLSW